MKQGAIVRCYHLTEYLEAILKSLEHLDGVLVMNYRFDGVPEAEDDTKQIVDKLNQVNVTYNTGNPLPQQEVFNKALKIFEYLQFDWVWINDADEFILRDDRDEIINFLETHAYNGGTTNVIDYTKFGERAGIRTHRPTVIVRPYVRFFETRCADYSNWYFKDIYMHHFGHMMKDKEWKEKHLWYSKHSYDNVLCTKHEKCEVPDEIKEFINGT